LNRPERERKGEREVERNRERSSRREGGQGRERNPKEP
jgi:hypothetical protein